MKKPFYRTTEWRISACLCIAVVSGVGLWTFIHKGQPEIVFTCMNYPVLKMWEVVGKLLYGEGTPEQMLGLIPMLLLSIATWWVFLGAVLGTVIYFIVWQNKSKSSYRNNTENRNLLASVAEQLKMDAATIEMAKSMLPSEQTWELDKIISRSMELAEQAMQKAKELQSVE